MTSAEKKARELVERWGIDRAEKILSYAELIENEKIRLFYQSVREHILKLKNEGK